MHRYQSLGCLRQNKDACNLLIGHVYQGLCHHIFEVLMRTLKERVYDDHLLLNFWWDFGI
jgi:hypothetical protein